MELVANADKTLSRNELLARVGIRTLRHDPDRGCSLASSPQAEEKRSERAHPHGHKWDSHAAGTLSQLAHAALASGGRTELAVNLLRRIHRTCCKPHDCRSWALTPSDDRPDTNAGPSSVQTRSADLYRTTRRLARAHDIFNALARKTGSRIADLGSGEGGDRALRVTSAAGGCRRRHR